jgi:O-antigen ligase
MLRLATIIIGVLVGLSPLILGGNRPALWTFHAITAAFALGVTGMALATRHGRQISLAPETIAPAGLMGMLLIGWILIQLIPWGGGLAHPIWNHAGGSGTISIEPEATRLALLRLLTAMTVFLATYCVARQRENAGLLLGLLIGFFCFYAVYGLIRLSFSIDRIWWFTAPDPGFLTATFINRNNAATYFGLGVVAVTALLVRTLHHTFGAINAFGSARREAIVSALTGRVGAITVIWLLLLTALFLTGSRGGIVASIIAVGVMLFLRALRGACGGAGSRGITVVICLALGLITVMEISGAKFLERIIVSGFEDPNREYAAQATLQAVWDHLWLGAGAGSFQTVFPLYRPAALDGSGFWNHAHNDYLEALLGLGLPGFCAMVLMLGSLFLQTLRGVFQRRRDSHFALIAVSGSVLVGLHAFVDFSLQIQGVTLAYAALLGLGVAQSRSSRMANNLVSKGPSQLELKWIYPATEEFGSARPARSVAVLP